MGQTGEPSSLRGLTETLKRRCDLASWRRWDHSILRQKPSTVFVAGSTKGLSERPRSATPTRSCNACSRGRGAMCGPVEIIAVITRLRVQLIP